MEKNSKINKKFGRYLPGIGIAAVTLLLMFYFKANRENQDIIHHGTEALASFYTENLKPLFFKTDITNEDVFNFALYNNLPLDKKGDKVLEIVDSPGGKQEIGIKEASIVEGTDNLGKFIKKFGLENERDKIDSLLSSYREDLYASVYYNDINTIAVDPGIAELQDKIASDLYRLAKNEKITPSSYSYAYGEGKAPASIKKSDMIFFTPDTIFRTAAEINRETIKKQIEEAKKLKNSTSEDYGDFAMNVSAAGKGLKIFVEKMKKLEKVKYDIDSSFSIVEIPEVPEVPETAGFDNKDLQQLINLKMNKLQKAGKDASFGFNFDADSADQSLSFSVSAGDGDTVKAFTFEFNLRNLDKLIENSVKEANKGNVKDWSRFGLKVDSLVKNFQYDLEDSLYEKAKEKENERTGARVRSKGPGFIHIFNLNIFTGLK